MQRSELSLTVRKLVEAGGEAVHHQAGVVHGLSRAGQVALRTDRLWALAMGGYPPLDGPYAPDKRTMLKIKHARTADVVALGYRIHKSGSGVGSLLVGLYDDGGVLRGVGGVAAWSDKRRLELIDELAPLVERDPSGDAVTGETDRSRFSASKDVSFVRLRPERVLEVRYDQLEGMRFRHTVQFERWRPDRDASSCRFDQLEQVSAYDLGRVLD